SDHDGRGGAQRLRRREGAFRSRVGVCASGRGTGTWWRSSADRPASWLAHPVMGHRVRYNGGSRALRLGLLELRRPVRYSPAHPVHTVRAGRRSPQGASRPRLTHTPPPRWGAISPPAPTHSPSANARLRYWSSTTSGALTIRPPRT